VSVTEYRKIWEEFREAHRDPQDDLIELSPENPEYQQNEEIKAWNAEVTAAKSKPQWVTGTELQQKETKSSKTLKMALNLVCPTGTISKTHAEIKEQLEDYGIHLNEIARSIVCRVRKALGIEIAGGVNPTWSRPLGEI